MESTDYVSTNFVTRNQLLKIAESDLTTLIQFQELKCMPVCSYQLVNNVTCSSPVASFEATETIEYYPRAYAGWLSIVTGIGNPAEAFEEFSSRYSSQVDLLLKTGLGKPENKFSTGLKEHLQTEWSHFLAGTYGVCTKSGLPEDIATKELAASRITQLISDSQLDLQPNSAWLSELKSAVDLMDSACSEFAPHERAESSRQRLIVDVRSKYKLPSDTHSLTQN